MTTAIIEAIGYAADRGADIISMSFGSTLLNPDVAETIAAVLKAHPHLVIVASSGNAGEAQAGIAFPAAVQGVVAVGATDLNGYRAPYSSFGAGLDVVAPGGNTASQEQGGILTTCGIEAEGFWQGIAVPTSVWEPAQDLKGADVWTQGTSFSAPIVAGVLALMKGEDPQRHLTRHQLLAQLKTASSYESLRISQEDAALYHAFKLQSKLPPAGTIEQFFFGSGLVNAEVAIQQVHQGHK